jgi:hypothetical protein
VRKKQTAFLPFCQIGVNVAKRIDTGGFCTACKSAAYRFDGSNPSSPTKPKHQPKRLVFLVWYGYLEDGFERAAPVDTLVQKLRAGEQFLARGRIH